jgi:AraC-like DNA-binding protein
MGQDTNQEMPIFMDRHELLGAGAKDVAQAHQKDLEMQERFGCRALTYWFDEARGTAFCLIEAPSSDAVAELHNHAHGFVPTRIIEVDTHLVDIFLGRIVDPESSRDAEAGLPVFEDPASRTIMVTELKDAAIIKSTVGVAAALKLFGRHRELVEGALDRFGGRPAKHGNDQLVASFVSVSKAVQCAIEMQREFGEQKLGDAVSRLEVGIGLSAGEPVTDEKDLFQAAIAFAQHLSYVAHGGEVLVSSTVGEHYKQESLEVLAASGMVRRMAPLEEDFLNRLMSVTERTWNQDGLHIDDFAKKMGLSKAQLYRKTTSLTGHSPAEFLKEYRLRRAVELIERQQGNITQIAFETGFGNPSYFSKCFQKRFGVLPSDFAASVA